MGRAPKGTPMPRPRYRTPTREVMATRQGQGRSPSGTRPLRSDASARRRVASAGLAQRPQETEQAVGIGAAAVFVRGLQRAVRRRVEGALGLRARSGFEEDRDV